MRPGIIISATACWSAAPWIVEEVAADIEEWLDPLRASRLVGRRLQEVSVNGQADFSDATAGEMQALYAAAKFARGCAPIQDPEEPLDSESLSELIAGYEELTELLRADDRVRAEGGEVDWDAIDSPSELARKLWHIPSFPAVWGLAPERFQCLFDRVYQSTDDIEDLWQLGGATNDYLRANPDSIQFPAELPRRLLASDHRDGRIIGLKLLNRCAVTDDEVVRAITHAMNRHDGYESSGGMCELVNFLEQRYPSGTGLADTLVGQLLTALDPLVRSRDEHVSEGAAQVKTRLEKFQ